MLLRHWKSGWNELVHELNFDKQLKLMQAYIPELRKEHFFSETKTGVRSAVVSTQGEIIEDFLFDISPGKTQLHVRNAPSPAATACFAIAKEIVEKAQKSLLDFPK
jgi:L-2-hydroxyglutarate oxidase LhgO